MTAYPNEASKIRAAGVHFDGAYAAGGAVTSVFTATDINDVDVYFKSRKAFETAVADCYNNSMWCVASSKRAVTFSDNGSIIQLMHFDFFPTAGDIFKAFDFTVVMGAYDYDAAEFVLHPDFMRHNSQRFLRFNAGTRYPLATAARVLKYQKRGYTIGKGDIMRIALAVKATSISSWDDLRDQIGGAYGDKVVVGTEDTPFSLEAAIEALATRDDGSEQWVTTDNDPQPGTAVGLLKKIAEMKGEPFDESRFDADGWPIEEIPLAA